MVQTTPAMAPPADTTFAVFFDGACPLCRREIAFYRNKRGADAIHWIDLTAEAAPVLAEGLTCEAALQRFHVRDEAGRLHSGAKGFAELWMRLPSFRWLGRIVLWPPVTAAAEVAYRLFLKIRPAMQRAARAADA